MENLPPGTIALAIFGVMFFGLQAYWILNTLGDLKKQGIFDRKKDPLAETRKQLEEILKK